MNTLALHAAPNRDATRQLASAPVGVAQRDITKHAGLLWVVAGACISLAVRSLQLHSRQHPDEVEYLYVARWWARGAHLYRDVFVDRPQLLLGLFRGLSKFSTSDPVPLRLFTMAWGCLLIAAVAALIRAVGGSWRATACGTLLFSCLSALPAFQGQYLNGELLAALPATLCVAAGLVAVRAPVQNVRRERALLLVAGVLGACAFLFKQSGVDGIVALGCWLLVRRDSTRLARRVQQCAIVALAAATTVGVAALHGAHHGFNHWFTAMVGSRADQVATETLESYLARFLVSQVQLVWFLVLALVGTLVSRRCLRGHTNVGLLWIWLALSVAGILYGASFWSHYYLALFPAGCALFGLSLDVLWNLHRKQFLAYTALCVVVLATSGKFTRDEFDTKYYRSADKLTAAVREVVPPNERVAFMTTGTAVKGMSDRLMVDIPLKTIFDEFRTDTIPLATSTLSSEQRPTFVLVQDQDNWPKSFQPIGAVLNANYAEALRIDRFSLYKRADAAT